jgi:hypothetical protein
MRAHLGCHGDYDASCNQKFSGMFVILVQNFEHATVYLTNEIDVTIVDFCRDSVYNLWPGFLEVIRIQVLLITLGLGLNGGRIIRGRIIPYHTVLYHQGSKHVV